MNDPKQQVSHSRRKFLRDATVTGGIAAVAVGSPGTVIAAETEQTAERKPTEAYRLTQHILDYYKSAAS